MKSLCNKMVYLCASEWSLVVPNGYEKPPDPSHPWRITNFYPEMHVVVLGWCEDHLVPFARATVKKPRCISRNNPIQKIPCKIDQFILTAQRKQVPSSFDVSFLILCLTITIAHALIILTLRGRT